MARGTTVVKEEPLEAEPIEEPRKTNDVRDLTKDFLEKKVEIRGVEFTLRELSQEEYDDCAKMATGPNGFDSILLLKVMLTKSLVEPRLSAEEIRRLPFKVTNELRAVVNRMHWGADEITTDAEGNVFTGPAI